MLRATSSRTSSPATTTAASAAAATARTLPISSTTVRIRRRRLLPPRPNGHRNPLHALALSHIHAVVDGEVAADQVRAHGGILAGQQLGGTDGVGLIFAVVNADGAGVAHGL